MWRHLSRFLTESWEVFSVSKITVSMTTGEKETPELCAECNKVIGHKGWVRLSGSDGKSVVFCSNCGPTVFDLLAKAARAAR